MARRLKVVCLPRDIDGSGCYRNLLPARELRLQLGWDAHMAPHTVRADGRTRLLTYGDGQGGIDKWLLETDFDVLLWQQRGEPWCQGLAARLRAQGKRVLVDSDDAWWGLPDWNPGSRRPKTEVQAMRKQLAAADGLSVATPALAELYRPYQPNIRVIRNYLDWHMWEDITPAYEQERRHVRIGWMGDTQWRQGDLAVLRDVLPAFLRRHPTVEFVAAGDPRVHDLLGIPRAQRVTTGRVEFYNFDLADITNTFDIGLVPLDMSTPEARLLNECKSHLKGLEYNACGIPFVATPTESYDYWTNEGQNGCTAMSGGEWADILEMLVTDEELRRNMGRIGREKAEMFSLQNTGVGMWEDWIAGSRSHPESPRARELAVGSVGER